MHSSVAEHCAKILMLRNQGQVPSLTSIFKPDMWFVFNACDEGAPNLIGCRASHVQQRCTLGVCDRHAYGFQDPERPGYCLQVCPQLSLFIEDGLEQCVVSKPRCVFAAPFLSHAVHYKNCE